MNRFDAIFEHSHIGIIISDDGGVIESINPFAANMFGYVEEELVGKKIEILLPYQIREKHIIYREEYSKKPEPRSMGIGLDLHAMRKDESEFSVEISICSYILDGQQKNVSFINDITERKKSEDQLKKFNIKLESKVEERTKELSQALVELNHINKNLEQSESQVRVALEKEKDLNEMKSRFVSMASHEFRTPLAGILTSASLIGRYHESKDVDKRDKHIKTIKRSVKNLTTILGDFLSLDKLEQGMIRTNLVIFKLEEFVGGIVEDLMDLSGEGQQIIYRHNGDDCELIQDKDMLRNIIINLLSNAVKYSPNEKDVVVETMEIEKRMIKISISDQGMGIPEKEQKYLFQKFFRAKNAINLEGTGLGLNIVKRYLDLMKGDITFISEENVGTNFTITIPMEVSDEKNSID